MQSLGQLKNMKSNLLHRLVSKIIVFDNVDFEQAS